MPRPCQKAGIVPDLKKELVLYPMVLFNESEFHSTMKSNTLMLHDLERIRLKKIRVSAFLSAYIHSSALIQICMMAFCAFNVSSNKRLSISLPLISDPFFKAIYNLSAHKSSSSYI